MKKQIIILGLALGLISCTQTKYFVKSENDLSKIDLEQNILNYIPLMNKDMDSSKILDSTYKLLSIKKYSKLYNYLSKNQSDSPDYFLAKTLYHISKTEYQDAADNLRKINDGTYDLLKQLLSIDLSYELAKIKGSKDFKKFLHDYQMLIDKYPDNEQLKRIVSLRIRYIRYNY